MTRNIYDFTLSQLETEMEALSQKKFRAKQLFKWLYEKRVKSFDDMSDISIAFREILKEKYVIQLPSVYTRSDSNDGTIKILSKFSDGLMVETVFMPYSYGNATCVSSQVGCNMGCKFCASGLLKKKRNLTSGEMVGQVLLIDEMLKEIDPNSRVTHVVVMGTGEPFDNYDNVISFVRIINEQIGLAIGARHITISTCGITEKIRKFADENLQVNLAISLHAPNDQIRNEIMPINNAHNLEDLIDAVRYYSSKSNRLVTFEYIVLQGVNDTLDHAKQLVELIKPTNGYVNLIPYNEVSENGFHRSSGNAIHRMHDYILANGIKSTIRKEFGSDIDAACGQLRAKYE